MTLTETILAIANVVFIIIAIFLFVRLRKMGKKVGTENKQQSELADITGITPEEFKPERFELKVQDIAQPEKTTATASDIFAESEIGVQEKTELKLEEILPGEEEKPEKKERKKKRPAKKRKVPAQEEPLIKTEPVQETVKEEKTARKKKKTLI